MKVNTTTTEATAFANLYSQAVALAALIENNGYGFARLYVEK